MTLADLAPYFELYKKLKENDEDIVLNKDLQAIEKQFVGKEITMTAVISELDIQKNELIGTYKPQTNSDGGFSIKKLTGTHFFIFASSQNLAGIIQLYNLEKDDLVQITGSILSLHRHSVVRVSLISISVIEKNHGITKAVEKKGCFIATAVYGSADANQVQQFYFIRDNYLAKSTAGNLFIKFYYAVSPTLAKWIDNKPKIKSFTRKYILDKILSRYN
jgi:hypothetical protein